MIVFLLLILVFIFIEKSIFHSIEHFLSTDYDYFYNGDVLIDTRKQNLGIGVGNNSDSRYAINIGGTLFVRDKFCYGNTCLDAKILDKLSHIPHFKPDKLCLKTPDGDKVCIEEEHLQLLTGQRALRLKSKLSDSRAKGLKNPQYFKRQHWYSHPNHDDDDDYHPPHCGSGNEFYPWNTCSHRIGSGAYGNFHGYGANSVKNQLLTNRSWGGPGGCFRGNNSKFWYEIFPDIDKFAIQVNPEKGETRETIFPKVERNFKPKPINYKCINST